MSATSQAVLHQPIRWDLLAQDIVMVSQAPVRPRCAGVEIETSGAYLPHNGKYNNLHIASFELHCYKFDLTHDDIGMHISNFVLSKQFYVNSKEYGYR